MLYFVLKKLRSRSGLSLVLLFSCALYWFKKNKTTTNHQAVSNLKSLRFVESAHSFDIQELLKITLARQKERREVLLNACRRRKKMFENFSDLPNTKVLYSNNYKFSVCDINKCGSTSWLQAVMVMDGYSTLQEYFNGKVIGEKVIRLTNRLARLSSYESSGVEKKWNNSLRILTVRNPFQRLVSAYNGKLRPESDGFTYLYGPLSKSIYKRFRNLRYNKAERTKLENGTASFEDFANFLLYSSSDKKNDPHWRKFDVTCEPCVYDYDFIMKFETISDDVAYLKEFLHLSSDHKQAFFPGHESKTTASQVKDYYSKIPDYLAKALYEEYEVDFELFGYPRPSWLSRKAIMK